MIAVARTHCPVVDQHGISARPDTQPLVSEIEVHTDGLHAQGCWQCRVFAGAQWRGGQKLCLLQIGFQPCGLLPTLPPMAAVQWGTAAKKVVKLHSPDANATEQPAIMRRELKQWPAAVG